MVLEQHVDGCAARLATRKVQRPMDQQLFWQLTHLLVAGLLLYIYKEGCREKWEKCGLLKS